MGTTFEDRALEATPEPAGGGRKGDLLSWLLLVVMAALTLGGAGIVVHGLTLLPEAHRKSQLAGSDGIEWFWPGLVLTAGGLAVLVGCTLGWWESRRHPGGMSPLLRRMVRVVLLSLALAAGFSMLVQSLGDRCWGSCG